MVQEKRRHLSHVPNVHSRVSFAKSAQKIRNLDCPQLFGVIANALLLDEHEIKRERPGDDIKTRRARLVGRRSSSTSPRMYGSMRPSRG